MQDYYNTVIVGAGLSGLYLARLLKNRGEECLILEARSRIGGRVLTVNGHDLGPSWFWPGQQRMTNLINTLGLKVSVQQDQGDLMYDNGSQVRRLPPQPQQPSYRIDGGLGQLIQRLSDSLTQSVRLNTTLRAMDFRGPDIVLTVDSNSSERTFSCHRVYLTLPPKLLNRIEFLPELDSELTGFCASTPTWMASHAKAVITYDSAFWLESGLSGDAFSQRGPLAEIHDASTADQPALFGFFGWDARRRQQHGSEELEGLCIDQLQKLFGEPAGEQTAILLQDWADEPFTATESDQSLLNHHPQYGLSDISLSDRRIILAGTETSPEFGGFLEGALASAERAIQAGSG